MSDHFECLIKKYRYLTYSSKLFNLIIHTLLEIVSGIKKVCMLSGIKHFKYIFKAMFGVMVFIPLSKSPSFQTVWGPHL